MPSYLRRARCPRRALVSGYAPWLPIPLYFDLRHGVWFPMRKRGEARDGQRWAFMFRWSNGRTRSFDKAYPHRLQMTEGEKVELAARQEAAAARAKRWACPPESTHTMSKRARVKCTEPASVRSWGVCTGPARVRRSSQVGDLTT